MAIHTRQKGRVLLLWVLGLGRFAGPAWKPGRHPIALESESADNYTVKMSETLTKPINNMAKNLGYVSSTDETTGESPWVTAPTWRSRPYNQYEVQTFVSNLSCFYDGGEEGSNPSVFNGARITPAGSPFPSASGQYIEAKNSGECFGANSTMNLKINDFNNNQEIGEVDFVENGRLL